MTSYDHSQPVSISRRRETAGMVLRQKVQLWTQASGRMPGNNLPAGDGRKNAPVVQMGNHGKTQDGLHRVVGKVQHKMGEPVANAKTYNQQSTNWNFDVLDLNTYWAPVYPLVICCTLL